MNFDSWLDTPILGNAAGHWLTALGGALGATAMILGLRTMARRRLAGLAAQTDTIADDLVIEARRGLDRQTFGNDGAQAFLPRVKVMPEQFECGGVDGTHG